MLLTCPKCRSGLEVPDGTTAMVRCPACKTVFSPADSPPLEEEEDEPKVEERPKTKRKPNRRENDEDKPRKKSSARDNEKGEEKEENRDFDPLPEKEERRKSRKQRRREAEEKLSQEEKAARRAAFDRAAIGCKLIWISFGLFLCSMMLIVAFYFWLMWGVPVSGFLVLAGLCGLVNWALAAIGVGLCLSGPSAPGSLGYGIAAGIATGIHGFFLLAVLTQPHEMTFVQVGEEGSLGKGVKWTVLPTRIDATMFYLTKVFYNNEPGLVPQGRVVFSMVAGLFEMIRTVLIMMVLSCLSRAACDEDLAHKCTRAAGVASFGPGLVALLILVAVMVIVETGMGRGTLTTIVLLITFRGVYAILGFLMIPAFRTARDVADACDEPYQALIPQL